MSEANNPQRVASCRRGVTIVVAAADSGVIGRGGALPWRLPADLARFKKLTTGHPIVMGRKTYESIGRPLPGRVSIVLTRDGAWRPSHDEVLLAADVPSALAQAAACDAPLRDEPMVIGGGEVYRLALPYCDRVYLTRVHATIEGDATFPTLAPAEWRLTSAERHEADERNEHPFTFETWERVE